MIENKGLQQHNELYLIIKYILYLDTSFRWEESSFNYYEEHETSIIFRYV